MQSRISQMRNAPQPSQNQQQYQIDEEYLQKLKTLMHSKNALQYITEVASMNPQFKNIIDMARGNNLQAIFEDMARQRGIDANWLLNKLLS